MSHAPSDRIPWKPGHLLCNEHFNICMDPVALTFEPRRRQVRYMAVIQVVDEILENLCQTESRE